jgi:hypothetical protein
VRATQSALARLADDIIRAVGTAARHSAFPIALLVAMGLFLLLQDRIDRRDPKLALAPLHADPKLDFD